MEKDFENMSLNELLAENKKMLEQKQIILDECYQWMSCYELLQEEMKSRIEILELEIYCTEQDRMSQDDSKYDYLCRVH